MTGKISSGLDIDIVEVAGKAILHEKAYFVYVLDNVGKDTSRLPNKRLTRLEMISI